MKEVLSLRDEDEDQKEKKLLSSVHSGDSLITYILYPQECLIITCNLVESIPITAQNAPAETPSHSYAGEGNSVLDS